VTTDFSTKAPPLIDIAGNARTRGLQYGEKAKAYILKGMSNYKEAYAAEGISWARACEIAAGYIPLLQAQEQDLFEEIIAIAEGADVSVEEILALNCRTEIIYGGSNEVKQATDGCTGAIALPGATAEGVVLHGQNWDWRDECAETMVVLRIRPETGPEMLIQTEAGILARCGINSSGIALTGNFLKCERDNQAGGIPIPFIRRHILEQESYTKALEVVLTAPKSFSTNIMISHRDGEAIDFETTPGETFWLQPQNGLLVHANHFESHSALAKVSDEGLKVAPCSLHRVRRVRESLQAKIGSIVLSDFITALADKFDNPHGVCAEPDTGPGGDNSSTVATILMNVNEGKMWIATRPYEPHSYTEYSLGG